MLTRLASAVVLAVLVANAGAQSLYRWVDKNGRVHYSDQPPPQTVKQFEEKKPGAGNMVETSGPSFATQEAQKNFPVTVYVGAECGAPCQSALQFLAGRGVPYAEVVVEGEDAANRFKGLFGGKEVFVPAITVGSRKMKGFDAGSWKSMLDEAGYPTAPGATEGSVGAAPKAP
jgi:hypothetical protein